ncbi:MAG: signal peptidase II [Actinobacteria bacterium HGW-Actinobacteria-6]|nr:MAG: signal peptidase II [Actinobacteria bacterium HGW-Actinobacteria-6]
MQRRSGAFLAGTALLVVAVDQISKAAIRANFSLGESVPLIKGVINLTYVRNMGAAFGLFPGKLPVFIAISIGVLGGIAWVWWRIKPQSRWVALALGLVAGGATGNLIDRIVAGRVTDFFDVGWWPVFNIADMALDIGVAILLFWLLFSGDEFFEEAGEDATEPEPEATS